MSSFYIPIEKIDLLDDPNNPLNSMNKINWISHIVQSGDSLWKLADKYDTEVNIIEQINYLDNSLLTIGMTLLIPLSKSESNNFFNRYIKAAHICWCRSPFCVSSIKLVNKLRF